MNKEQAEICRTLTAEWTRAFLKNDCTPLLLLGAVNGTNKIGYALAPGIEKDTALQLLRGAIELLTTNAGIITL